MPPLPEPGTALLLFLIGGVFTVLTFTAYKYAESEGKDVGSWLPKPPKLPALPDIPARGE